MIVKELKRIFYEYLIQYIVKKNVDLYFSIQKYNYYFFKDCIHTNVKGNKISIISYNLPYNDSIKNFT